MLAIVDAYKKGLLKPNNWINNILSGTIVGVVALPLAMAFAIATGVKPEQGLYTAIIAALAVGLFGGSQVQIAGPTGAFIVILAGITAQYGVAGLQIATFMAGLLLLLMGFLRLGSVIRFIPDPVIVGFTSGIGIIIFIGEWKDFFGLATHTAINAPFYEKILALGLALPQLDLTTTCLALLTLAMVLITPIFIKRLPGPLVGLVVATIIQTYFHFPTVATLGSVFGGIPQTLPVFQIPSVPKSVFVELLIPAFSIALLGAIESLLSATAADGMARTRHAPNQELIGQGIANLVCPLFGGFAATGAIARTATNVRNGGNSPISAIVHSLFLLLTILILAPLASNIPLCCLAAILFVVAYNMSDVPHFLHVLKHAPRSDSAVLLATFFLTIFTNLVIAVNIGVILAMIFFIRKMVQSSRIECESNEPSNGYTLPSDTLVYSIQGPFFFGITEKMQSTLAITHSEPSNIILRLKEVPFMDISGLLTLQEVIENFKNDNIKVYLCEANKEISKKIQSLGLLENLAGHRIYGSVKEIAKVLSGNVATL